MRVIVAGGRSFNNRHVLNKVLSYLFSKRTDIVIVCGMARGADLLGKEYASEHSIPVNEYPADWGKYGKSAGYKRNTEMVENADALVAFWDGQSRGTKHMIDIAHEMGLIVKVYDYEGRKLC